MEFLHKIGKFVEEGGAIEYLILAFFALGLSIVGERLWFYFLRCRRNPTALVTTITALLRKEGPEAARKTCLQGGDPAGLILAAGLWKYEQAGRIQEIREAIEEVSAREMPRLQKRTHYLGLLANICTLIGLLGTIFGLQEAFSALESADPSQKSKILARGITLALNATALGLISAMTCMAAFSFLGSKANELTEQIDEAVLRLTHFLASQLEADELAAGQAKAAAAASHPKAHA